MRPIGFEAPMKRLERSLVVGLVAGVALSLVATLVVLEKRAEKPASLPVVVGLAFAIGFFAGFGLAIVRPEFAPAQPRDDGDAEAGVPARVKPPLLTLSESADLNASDEKA